MAIRSTDLLGTIRRALLIFASSTVALWVPQTGAEVRIGLVGPLTGPMAHYGHWMEDAAKDAVTAINRAGGIKGDKVVLRTYDDRCQREAAVLEARRLLDDNLMAVVGHCTSVAASVRRIYEDAGLPLIIPNATLADLGGPSTRSVFHLGAREDRLAEAAWRLMRENNAGNRVGVLEDGSRAASELIGELRRRTTVVFAMNVRDGSSNAEIASQLLRASPDTIFVAALEPDRAVASLRRIPDSIPVYVAGLPTANPLAWERFWTLLGRDAFRVRVVAPREISAERGIAAEALLNWRSRPDGPRLSRQQPPAIYGAVLAAFELLYGQLNEIANRRPQAIRQVTEGRSEIVHSLRAKPQLTVLGPLRSGETGELQVLYSLHAPSREWTPAGSQPRVLAAMKPPAAANGDRPVAAFPSAPAPTPVPPAPAPAPKPAAKPAPAPTPPPPAPAPAAKPAAKPAPKPPSGPRVAVLPQLQAGVFWNSWIESGGIQKTQLAVGEAYDLAVDLARYRYVLELSADAGTALLAEIRKAREDKRSEITLVVRPVMVGSALQWGSGTQRDYRLTINVPKLASPSPQQLREDTAAWQSYMDGNKSLREISALFNALTLSNTSMPFRVPVVAAGSGCAQIALSIWDATGTRPLDHLVHTVSVAEADACGIGAQASVRAGFSTLLEAAPNPAFSSQLPHAAMHVFELAPTTNGPRGLALFLDATPLQKKEQAKLYVWALETNIGAYVSDPDLLLRVINNARRKGNYMGVAKEMRSKLFSAPAGKQADAAFEALQRIAKDSAPEASILTRVASTGGKPIYLPLGLLAVAGSKDDKALLERRIRVIHPSPEPSLALVPQCVDPWTFVVPKALQKFDGEPLEASDSAWIAANRQATLAQLRTYLGEQKPQPGMPPAVNPANGEGLLVLAHQAKGHLWFDDDADRVGITELKRQFRPGSVAILSACSSASPDSDNDQWLNKISARGVDTIFASPFPVPLEYGVLLTRSFVRAVREAREKQETPTVASLFEKASDEAAKGLGSGVSKDIRLEFVVIGDPEIRLCR